MRVLLCTNGTHGDVNPFLGLGRELRRRGHAVTVFVNPYFESDVTAAGLEFLAQGEYIDIPSFIREHKIMEQRGGARRMVRKVFRETPGTIPVLRRRCDGPECPDIIVAHTMCLSPEWICRERSIPHVSLAITPLNWWSRHDPIPAIQRERGRRRAREPRRGRTRVRLRTVLPGPSARLGLGATLRREKAAGHKEKAVEQKQKAAEQKEKEAGQ